MSIVLLCCVVGIALLYACGVSVPLGVNVEAEGGSIWYCTAEVAGQSLIDGSMRNVRVEIARGRSSRTKAEREIKDEICDAIRDFTLYDGEPCALVPIDCTLTKF